MCSNNQMYVYSLRDLCDIEIINERMETPFVGHNRGEYLVYDFDDSKKKLCSEYNVKKNTIFSLAKTSYHQKNTWRSGNSFFLWTSSANFSLRRSR